MTKKYSQTDQTILEVERETVLRRVEGVTRVEHVDAVRDEIEKHLRVAHPEIESRFFGLENRENVSENRTDFDRNVDLQSVLAAGVESVDEVSVDLAGRKINK